MEYIIAHRISFSDLEVEVNDRIKDGFVPFGNIVLYTQNNVVVIGQPMTRVST